ncbi:hypothetical protein QBC46DRAFT_262605, partial [Diplogelasinospora grovesii]
VTSENTSILSRPRYSFIIINGLLYNIRLNGTYNLYVPYLEIKLILSVAYDNKYYFKKDYILYELRKLLINKKTY